MATRSAHARYLRAAFVLAALGLATSPTKARADADPKAPMPKAPKALAAPAPFQMRFQFDQNGTPSMHTFIMKWGAANANLQSIDVIVSDTDEVIQTIAIPQDRVHIVWQDLTEKPDDVAKEIREKIVESVDYNFDKFADLRLLREWPYKVGKKSYLVWLFDEDKNQYVLNEAISALSAPTPDPKTRQLEAVEVGGYGGGEYVRRSYSLSETGKLKVECKITQTIKDRVRLSFYREVKLRIEGELQRVCKITVPPEGKPTLTWGKKTTCAPYLTK